MTCPHVSPLFGYVLFRCAALLLFCFRTIVDAHVTPRGALLLAGVMLFAAVAAVLPTIAALRVGGAAKELEVTFWVGVGMVFSYTCWPFR